MIRRNLILGCLGVVAAGVGGYLAFGRDGDKNKAHAASKDSDTKAVVRTVRPRLDPSFRISNQQIALVEPFYQAGLRARSAGLVRTVCKDIGESVRMGEVLVEIDAPELVQEVLQKEAVIHQRQQELRVSKSLLKHATAAVETARATIAQRTAEARQAEATRDFKLKLFTRLKGLLDEKAIRPEVVDENERDYRSAEALYDAGLAAILKAKADEVEKQASLEAATADVELKGALIGVAEKDRDKAAATASFARVVAPFDGVIVRRNVDPGMFVQNASTGVSEPLVTIARLDMVTVSMKLPDVGAPFISRNTEVEASFDQLPGLTVRGKVTRYSPAIDGTDRTMRVELDIFNGTRTEFAAFLASAHGEALAPLGGGNGLGIAAGFLAAERHRQMFHKGVSDGTAVCLDMPSGTGQRPLVPGMKSTMRVYLDRVSAAYLLPASAVYVQGGKTYILLVRDGVTHQVLVQLQVNDGRMAKVGLLASDGPGGVQELNGTEEVVVSRQSEVGDRVKVRSVLGDW